MSELVDLTDEYGRVQMRAIPRNERGRYPDLHMAIVVGVVFDGQGRLLVQRRAMRKRVSPGSLDHICGAIISGETPHQAVAREALQETGVTPRGLSIVTQGVNAYGYYRYLLVGESFEEPTVTRPDEVMWAGYLHPDDLHEKRSSGEAFVRGFFDDLAHAIGIEKQKRNQA
jgi:8-oxo-dGTP pyrophosphatase MutT (NUDIX family)